MTEDLIVESFMLRGDIIEVTFAEHRDQNSRVAIVKTLLIDRMVVNDQLQDVLESLADLVDEALLVMRQPPETLTRRRDR